MGMLFADLCAGTCRPYDCAVQQAVGDDMQVKKIFLASSEELSNDRRAFELMIGRLNKQWRERGIIFDLVVWEYFIDAMSPSPDGLQQEYNKAVEACDIFVMMFFTKVGRYTLEEFETAIAKLAAGTGPRIYTYFRNDFILTGDIDDNIKSLLEFKARLRNLKKHYLTEYRNTEDLQWKFSRQLEMLYGSDSLSSLDVTDSTPKTKIGEAALVLSYRQLLASERPDRADEGRLRAAVQRASRLVRDAIFNMAYELRRENWATDKHLMERTIPVFEALIRADPNWHAPHGQLGYALKDKALPDWEGAKASLDRAVELRGEERGGLYYQYNRAVCAIHLDPYYSATPRKPADEAMHNAIVGIIKHAKRDLGANWERVLNSADSAAIRSWLQLNGSPRLR
jgi:hypothetical protein